MQIEQGDIYKIEGLRGLFLVVSKDFFNKTEQAMICPVVNDTFPDPLHIKVCASDMDGIVMCEQLRLADLRQRGYTKVSQISYTDIINITDAIQSIFDY